MLKNYIIIGLAAIAVAIWIASRINESRKNNEEQESEKDQEP